MQYNPNKDYYVVGARNAWDTVPIGLFNSIEEAKGCFPDKPESIIRKATKKEINKYFNIEEPEKVKP